MLLELHDPLPERLLRQHEVPQTSAGLLRAGMSMCVYMSTIVVSVLAVLPHSIGHFP